MVNRINTVSLQKPKTVCRTLACELQTYLWSSLLSLRNNIRRKSIWCQDLLLWNKRQKSHLPIQIVFLQSIIYPPGKKIHWNKQHLGIIVLCCLPTLFLHLNVLFLFSFYSCIYLRSKISLLIWRFVIITKLKRWYVNLSASHSYFSSGSFAVDFGDHLRSLKR